MLGFEIGQRESGAPAAPIVLITSTGHKDYKYVLGIEIGQRESGFYSERTESQTDRQNHRTIQ